MKKLSRFINEAEQSKLQKEYEDFFSKKLKKFGAESPAELSDEDKTKFFTEVEKEWIEGKGESKSESVLEKKVEEDSHSEEDEEEKELKDKKDKDQSKVKDTKEEEEEEEEEEELDEGELPPAVNEKTKMNNLDWGKTTAERNKNLDHYDSLKTDKEKEEFLKKLKSLNEGKVTDALNILNNLAAELYDSKDKRLKIVDSFLKKMDKEFSIRELSELVNEAVVNEGKMDKKVDESVLESLLVEMSSDDKKMIKTGKSSDVADIRNGIKNLFADISDSGYDNEDIKRVIAEIVETSLQQIQSSY